MMHYILVNHEPVHEPDLNEWCAWFDDIDKRRVAKSVIGEQTVYTTFIGIDHGLGTGTPVLFETMVFPECDICVRYCTWDEAEAGHQKVVCDLLAQ